MKSPFIISCLGLLLVSCSDANTPVTAPVPNVPPVVATSSEPSVATPVPMPPVVYDDKITKLSDIDFGSYSTDLAAFIGLNTGDSRTVIDDKIHQLFEPNSHTEIGGHTEYSLTELKAEGGSVLIATAHGLADDSVLAKQVYAIFKQDVLVTYGMKIQCRRGDTPETWQTNLCP